MCNEYNIWGSLSEMSDKKILTFFMIFYFFLCACIYYDFTCLVFGGKNILIFVILMHFKQIHKYKFLRTQLS